MSKPKLHQCPCNPAGQCTMEESCLGCENYAEWANGDRKVLYTTFMTHDKQLREIFEQIVARYNPFIEKGRMLEIQTYKIS